MSSKGKRSMCYSNMMSKVMNPGDFYHFKWQFEKWSINKTFDYKSKTKNKQTWTVNAEISQYFSPFIPVG